MMRLECGGRGASDPLPRGSGAVIGTAIPDAASPLLLATRAES